MKKILMIIFMIGSVSPVLAQKGWTPVSKEQAERQAITFQIMRVKEQLTSLGASTQDSAWYGAIFQLLKSIGTPVSYEILQEMVANGELPRSYLNAA